VAGKATAQQEQNSKIHISLAAQRKWLKERVNLSVQRHQTVEGFECQGKEFRITSTFVNSFIYF
jgi:hypothetical protein